MSRRKKGEAPAADTAPAEDIIGDPFATSASDVPDVALDLAAETLTGDIRDFILDRLKYEQSKAPWHQRAEADQRSTVHEVETAVRSAVTTAVEIIAGYGRRTIKATVESVVFKDGIKATLTASKFDENRHQLADAAGKPVLIVVADPDDFTGERAPAEITPDQAAMFGDGVMAIHSETDEQSPFA